MKRRILSQVIPRQDVCLLCASRLNIASNPQTHLRNPRSRSFISSSRILQSTAAQLKDDNDEEFSMLKQNAGLSFPSRPKPRVTPPTAQVEQPQPKLLKPSAPNRTSERDSNQQVSPVVSREVNREPRIEKSKARGVDRPQSAFRSEQKNATIVRLVSGNGQARPSSSELMQQNTPRRSDNGQGRDKRSSEKNLAKQRPINSGQYHFRLSEQSQPNFTIKKYGTHGNADFEEVEKRRRETTRPGVRRFVPDQMIGADAKPLEDQEPIQEATDDVVEEVPEVIDAPAGSTFVPYVDQPQSQHMKPDRRARRSDRFDEADENSATPKTSSKPKSRGRGQVFDIDAFEAEEMLYGGGGRKKKKRSGQVEDIESSRPVIHLPEFIGVERLAQMLKINVDTFINKLEEEGFEGARYDHVLDSGTSAMFADLYGFEPIVAGSGSASDLVARPPPEDISALPSRPPIVTIMGHVDHGKTTILDFFRKSSVVASEHGGITQHIGAFSVVMPGTNKQITFLDTPGHAAFLEMRRRGANVTDIVVLVVAADDSVKPQTIEAIKHSLDANVQIIVAINKVDKPEADVERVKQDLTRHEIVVEDYGGDYQVIPVSGKTGQGMADLEEAIMTLSDVNDYRAELDGPAEGWVIESKVTVSGRVATVLVRRGTLRPGDCIVAGTTWARVRTLRNDAGVLVDAAPPGTPVQVDGWRGEDPSAGLEVLQAKDEDHAKEVVDLRLEQEENMKTAASMSAINNARSEEAEARAKVLAWEREQEWSKKTYGLRPKDNAGWVESEESSGPMKVHFVVKADVAGSVEAIVAAVGAIGNNEIVANVIHSSTGQLAESDIRMLATTGEKGYAISFNQVVDGNVARLAEAAGLSILDHNVIYKVTDNVKGVLADHLPPIITQRVLGEAEIGQVFEVTIKRNKVKIAGCKITNGTISRSNKVRVLRGSEIIFTGALDSLKNVKKDVTEMRKGTECGMGFEDWEDFQQGDQVQCFEEHSEKRTLY